MTVLWAVILGLVQGLAEFLPISSSGHLSILQNLFKLRQAESSLFFDVLLHLGTLVAVFIFYRKDIISMITEVFAFCGTLGQKTPADRKKRHYPAARLVLMIIIATLPLFLVLPINDKVELLYYKTGFIGAVLILTGILLYVSDRMPKGTKTEKNMTVGNALVIGLCQAVATIPGLSRSGTTISAGIAVGLDRSFAVKFSFILSIPAVLGANLLSLIKAIKEGIDVSSLPAYLIGMVVAGISGYLALGLINMVVKKGKFGFFAYYCVAVGALAIILSIVL